MSQVGFHRIVAGCVVTVLGSCVALFSHEKSKTTFRLITKLTQEDAFSDIENMGTFTNLA